MRMPTVFLAVAAVVLVTACTPSQPQPAPVRNYGPEAGGGSYVVQPTPTPPPRYVREPSTVVRQPPPSYPQPSSGSFQWHYRIADAQAAARAAGKLILVLSTKPSCSLCDKFKNQIVPAVSGQTQRVAVGYIYDITRPEVRAIDRTLRANLPGADLMPLVGFLTPELKWVHGFYGARSVAQFRGDIAAAQRIYPVARVSGDLPAGGPRMATVINEYGEPEWSAPGDVWPVEEPEPIDALTGYPAADQPQDRPVVADAPVIQPVDLPAVAELPAAPQPPADPRPVAVLPPAQPPADFVGIRTPMTEAPTPTVPTWSDAAVKDDTWGEDALNRALTEIRGGRYDAARSTLEEIQRRLPDSTYAREAAKGRIALYNSKRIRTASSGSERTLYLSRARRDLGSSMWSVLFV